MADALDIESANATARDMYLDVLKGVAIIIVVLSHALQFRGTPAMNLLLGVIYSFSMPLFMYLSGYAMAYSRFTRVRDVAARRARTLLVPYLAWTVIAIVLYGFPKSIFSEPLWEWALAVIAQGPWYLAAVFVFGIVMTLAPMKRGGLVTAVGTLGLILGAYALSATPVLSEWNLWAQMTRVFPFFVVGYLVNASPSWRGAATKVPTLALAATYALAVAALWPVWEGSDLQRHLMASRFAEGLTAPLLTVAAYVVAVAAGLSATLLIERAVRMSDANKMQPVAMVGALSLGIYVTHIPIVRALSGQGPLAVALSTVVALGAATLITAGITRIKLLREVFLGGR